MLERCRICTERFPTEAETIKYLAEYVESLPEEIRTPPERFEERLAVCADCASLSEMTCVKCGCYAIARAAKESMNCPAGKW